MDYVAKKDIYKISARQGVNMPQLFLMLFFFASSVLFPAGVHLKRGKGAGAAHFPRHAPYGLFAASR